MKPRKVNAILSVVLSAYILSGCGSFNTPPSSSSSAQTPHSPASTAEQSASTGPEAEKPHDVTTEPSPPATSGSAEETRPQNAWENTPEHFWELADHSQYLAGVVSRFHFEKYPKESYIYFESDGQEFCVRGSLGREHEGLLPFHSIYSYAGKESDECQPGWLILIYFEDDLSAGETTITQPKEIFLNPPDSDYTLSVSMKKTEYYLSTLQKNFDALEEKSVFSPCEALWRVGEYLGMDDAQMQSTSPGVYVYTNGQHTLSFRGLHYNYYYQLDREYAAEVHELEPYWVARYLDPAYPGDDITSQPFIEYEVMDEQGESRDFYYVSINGAVSTLQTLYDTGNGKLVQG